jgi:ribonuclease-3
MEIDDVVIKRLLGFKPKNVELYKNAFVHKSIAKELNTDSYERLEFVGDSVIGLIIASYLYEKYPEENEGYLTRIRTKIVSSKGLSKLAKTMNLDLYVKMNAKAMNQEWNKNPRILEDTFEALMGAFYLDKGLDSCRKFLIRLVEKNMESSDLETDTNYKDILMKFVQSRQMKCPEYTVTHTNGPDHAKKYTVQININNRKVSEGTDKSKKQAEQNAAYLALKCIGYVF